MANDDVLLGWGDGSGFGPDPKVNYNSGPGRNSWGFTIVSGTPPSLTFTNLWGGDNTLHVPTFGAKGGPILSAAGELYFSIYCYYPPGAYSNGKPANQQSGCPQKPSAPGQDQIAAIVGYSTDQGADWNVTSWSFLSAGFAGPIAFVQFGKDNTALPNALGGSGYVYGYVNDGKSYYLLRVPEKQVTTLSSYEILVGVSAQDVPSWSSNLADRAHPVGSTPGVLDNFVVYDPGLSQFIAAGVWGSACGQVVFYQSASLWGPWMSFAHYANWPNENVKPNDLTTLPGANGPTGNLQPDGFNLVPKWFSSDGRDFWVTFACYGDGDYSADDSYNDRFNLIHGTFQLKK
jgi:hypothetical protein